MDTEKHVDGVLCEVNGQIFRVYKNGDLWRRLKTGEYRLVHNTKNTPYGYCHVRCNLKMVFYHRIICYAFTKTFDIYNPLLQVDHIDGDRLNNRFDNLRVVTAQENQHNRRTARGYCYCKQSKKWKSYIRLNKKLINLGLYETEDEARHVYITSKKIYHPSAINYHH